nr:MULTISPECIES: Tn3 family transposase [unclassified Rhizobium]
MNSAASRTLFTIEWYVGPTLRRRDQAGFNKGGTARKLKRVVFFHERGEIRDLSHDTSIPCLRPQSGRQRDCLLKYSLSEPPRLSLRQ